MVLGIDISKRSFEVALLVGERVAQASFANDAAGFSALLAWLSQHHVERVHACLEATGRYGLGLATALCDAGHRVSLVNPRVIKAYAQVRLARTKTDRVDARLIADYCRRHQPRCWAPPDPARDRLRQVSRYLAGLTQQRQQERNRLQAGALDPLVEQALQDHLTFLDQQIVKLEAKRQQLLQAEPTLQQQHALLDSLPGIGPASATTLLAELPDVRLLARAADLVAYAGVDPSERQSGASVHPPTHISKQGNARLRTALFFPAMTAMTHCRVLQPFVQRLRQQGLARKAIIVAVMRKLLRWIYGVLKHQQPFDPAKVVPSGVAT